METITQQQGTLQQSISATPLIASKPDSRFIFLKCFLRGQQDAELLLLQRRRIKGVSARSEALRDALWSGYWSLTQEVERCGRELTERGHLLFAFPGTTHPGARA